MGLNLVKKKVICKPYEKLASIYDFVMNHVDYQQWTEYIITLLEMTSISVSSILDIACGSGTFGFLLKRYGYHYLGMDSSRQMIGLARLKMTTQNSQFPVWVGNMQQFRLAQPVDVVLCLYDSINYLFTPENWNRTFDGVFNSLKKMGLFIFDITTIKNSIESFGNFHSRDFGPGFSYDRKSYYDARKQIQHTEFLISFDSAKYTVFKEMHLQRIYSIDNVLHMCETSDLVLLAYYGDFTRTIGSEDAYRVHFILQKR